MSSMAGGCWGRVQAGGIQGTELAPWAEVVRVVQRECRVPELRPACEDAYAAWCAWAEAGGEDPGGTAAAEGVDDREMDKTGLVASEQLQCGCCGRRMPANRVTELDSSPGVYICLGCALSAARRVSHIPFPRLRPRELLHRLRHHQSHEHAATLIKAIPIFPVADLDRGIRFYEQLGFDIVERLDDYAVLESGQVELHLNQATDRTADEAFIHTTTDPTSLWQRLTDRQAHGVGPVNDQPWGLREFVTTDPDGNTLRIGHPSPCE